MVGAGNARSPNGPRTKVRRLIKNLAKRLRLSCWGICGYFRNMVSKLDSVPMLCGGQWVVSDSTQTGPVFNPSNGEVIARVPLSDAIETANVVEAAAAALPAWSETPVVERARLMFRYREVLQRNFDRLAMTVTREHGKTLVEAKASVQRGIEVVEFACAAPSLMMGEILPNLARGVDGETVRHPVGVCVGITPFNFPAMVPLWMFPVALVCGNTFVLKPSEKVPLSANLLSSELLLCESRPAGWRLQHRPRRQGMRRYALLTHPKVAAISFVGSTDECGRSTSTRPARNTASACKRPEGAKNHLDRHARRRSSIRRSPRRLQASRRSVAPASAAWPEVSRLHCRLAMSADSLVETARRQNLRQDDRRADRCGAGNSVDMGPVISARASRARSAGYLDIGAR